MVRGPYLYSGSRTAPRIATGLQKPVLLQDPRQEAFRRRRSALL